jgi:restriction endonuclease S subunit
MSEYQLLSLGQICSLIKDGTHGTHPRQKDGIPLISAKDVHDGRITISSDTSRISREEYETIHRTYEIKEDDLLISLVGSIGRCALVTRDHGIFSAQRSVGILRSNRSRVDPKYLYHATCDNQFQQQLLSRSKSTAQAGVYLGELAQCSIPLPPLPEQKKIAEILSGIDNVINSYMKQLKHRKLFYGSFLDKEISDSKGTRSLVHIEEVAIQSKKKGFGDLPIYSVSVEHGMIRRDSLERSLISSLDQKDNLYASAGSFCYNMMRMWQGASGITPEDCLVSPAYVVCRLTNAVLPEYFAIACRSKELINKFRVASRGITSDRWRLYYEDFAKVEIPLPDKSEQSAIIKRNKALLGSTYKLEDYLQKAIRLKESLSSDLLSGRKRVSI